MKRDTNKNVNDNTRYHDITNDLLRTSLFIQLPVGKEMFGLS